MTRIQVIDNANAPDKYFGWSSDRSFKLGYSAAQPLDKFIDNLVDINRSKKSDDAPHIESELDSCSML